ncbi:MAG: sensor histidine kinase [Leptothrix sp. (in: b-proteobacteria)]
MNSAVWTESKEWRGRVPALLLAVLLVVMAFLALSPTGLNTVSRGTTLASQGSALLADQPPHTLPGAGPRAKESLSVEAPIPETPRRHQPATVAVLAGAFAIGFVMLLLALTQRSLSDAGLAGAGALWAAHTGLAAAPVNHAVVQPGALLVILMGFAGLIGWSVVRMLKVPLRAGSGALAATSLALVALVVWALSAAGAVDGTVAQALVVLVILAIGLGLLVRVVDCAHRPASRQRWHAWGVAVALALALGCGAQELVLMAGWSSTAATDGVFLAGAGPATCWIVLLLLALLAAVRIDQVARTMRQMEYTHRAWRNRVRESQRALQATQARLSARERSDVLRQQRDRLLRELHDDMGQRLNSAIDLAQADAGGTAAARPIELQHLLDASLMDLRLALDALESGTWPLTQALHELRRRIEPLLRAHAVQLAWVVGAGLDTLVLTAAETLQILRIAQEALVNVVRHAHAANHSALTVELLTGETGRHLRLMIYDDGHPHGPVPTASAPDHAPAQVGHGWAMLQRQATALGAQLVVGPQPDGWTVELVLPLRGR